LRFRGECFRAHDPSWSWSPLSGEGAALRGRRFNWPGLQTLYLSLSFTTAFREVSAGFAHRLTPYVLCSYDVDCDHIVDLTTDQRRTSAKVKIDALACDWANALLAGREPDSWTVVRRMLGEGHAGILVPSFANGATVDDRNLVLWNWGPERPHKVAVFDPTGKLPKNRLSWSSS
jgi:RES domain-containing protein